MAIIDALHGRARMRRAWRQRARLVAALLVVCLALTLKGLIAIVAAKGAMQAMRGLGPQDATFSLVFRTLNGFSYCLGPLLGGVLVDGIGVKRTIAAALASLCLVALAGALAVPPLAFAVASPLAMNLLPGVILVAVVSALRLALPFRRRAPALALALLAVVYSTTNANTLVTLLPLLVGGYGQSGSPLTMPVQAAGAAALLAAWLLACPAADPETGLDITRPAAAGTVAPGPARMFADPAVWSLIAILACAEIVVGHELGRFYVFFDAILAGQYRSLDLVPILGAPLAFVAAAAVSDRVLRATRKTVAPRRAFLVLGFLAAGVAPLLVMVLPKDEVALTLVGTIGLGILRLAELLPADLAPRATAGRFVGVVWSGVFIAQLYAPQVLRTTVGGIGRPEVICGVAIAGAVLSALLMPRVRIPTERSHLNTIADSF